MSKRSRAAYEGEQHSGYILYGTPLPPLEAEVRDDGSFVPIWKQEVRDERGRKRLHGAFRGGFSAGYFNTVGSREGWTPTTFKSSRTERAKAIQARPEDFMDEEDLAEAAEARSLETSQKFAGLGSSAENAIGSDSLTLMELFTPAPEDTMGVKLLKKMGWKAGQGIGPKVMRRAVVSDIEDGDGGDADADAEGVMKEALHYFAPTNTEVFRIDRKNDRHGLGYTGDKRAIKQKEEMAGAHTVTLNPPRSRLGGGFGVGILNEEDEEDEDIYEIKPKSAYNQVIGGEGKRQRKQTNSPVVKASARHVFISKKASSAKSSLNLRKCYDGRLPLEGFLLSIEPMRVQDTYPLPEVPKEWVPAVSECPTTTTESASQPNLAQTVSPPKLDPHARGLLLGEAQLPGKSVFDFLSPAARNKIAAATGRKDLPPALNEAPPPGYASKPLIERIPKVDKSVAASALSGGFMPYADDLSKRARYRKFLEINSGVREGLPEKKADTSDSDWINELNEFASCARIFKAAPNMIASRFTSASSAASHIPSTEGIISNDPDVLIHRPISRVKEKSPAEQAASMGMYGPMTRTVEEFSPTRLLCKRFNLRPPLHVESVLNSDGKGNGGSNVVGFSANGANVFQFDQPPPERNTPIAVPPPSSKQLVSKHPKELISKDDIQQIVRAARGDDKFELPTKEQLTDEKRDRVNTEVNEALESEKATEDVFRAIFGDDSDEEP